jgi:hypothetical protein
MYLLMQAKLSSQYRPAKAIFSGRGTQQRATLCDSRLDRFARPFHQVSAVKQNSRLL